MIKCWIEYLLITSDMQIPSPLTRKQNAPIWAPNVNFDLSEMFDESTNPIGDG